MLSFILGAMKRSELSPEERKRVVERARLYNKKFREKAKGNLEWMAKRRADARIRSRLWRKQHPDYAKTEHRRAALRRYTATARAKYPEKRHAQDAVQRAVRKGTLIRQPCERCGSTSVLQAHHYLGYAPEHRLDVIWLCHVHHRAIHGQLPS